MLFEPNLKIFIVTFHCIVALYLNLHLKRGQQELVAANLRLALC